MINYIDGIILDKELSGLIILISGIGLYCNVPRINTYHLKDSIILFTKLIWSSENGPQLYGFSTKEEKNFFEQLISCSGIGPKFALSLLNHFDLLTIISAIKNNNPKLLSQAPGIGNKKAELIILELKNKIEFPIELLEKNTQQNKINEIFELLKHLGYKSSEIYKAAEYIKKEKELLNMDMNIIIKLVLSHIIS